MPSFKQYSNSQKRQKLSAFNHVYFEGDPQNWKISRLPDWMHFYGVQLSKELSGEIPSYYRKFHQGDVVMIDYGVPIGEELGGKHFGVVLSNNDTKFKKKILVVPLSSKYHREYADLGYNLLDGILALLNARINEANLRIENRSKRISEFIAANIHKSFTFTDDEEEFLQANNINISAILRDHSVYYFNLKHDDFKKLVEAVKNIDSPKKYPNILAVISYTKKIIQHWSKLLVELKEDQKNTNELLELVKKTKRYNKHSYAVITDVKTISKLKINKLSHFTISGNTKISDKALKIIKSLFIKTIE